MGTPKYSEPVPVKEPESPDAVPAPVEPAKEEPSEAPKEEPKEDI